MSKKPADRDDLISRRRAAGQSLDSIGKEVGLTRERVRQILEKIGGPTARDATRARQEAKDEAIEHVRGRIRERITADGAATIDEMTTWLQTTPDIVRLAWPKEFRSSLIQSQPAYNTWSDDDVRAALSAAATYDFPLRKSRYDELLRTGEVVGPSSVRLLQRFGTWRKSCDFAGTEADRAPRETYQSKWTDEDLLEFVQRYLTDPNESGSFAGFDLWRRINAEGSPSGATLRNRLGTWASIKRRALS